MSYEGTEMSKRTRSNEYADKMVSKWQHYDKQNAERGDKPFSEDHKLSIAWRDGFEAGQRHQIKIQKAKNVTTS